MATRVLCMAMSDRPGSLGKFNHWVYDVDTPGVAYLVLNCPDVGHACELVAGQMSIAHGDAPDSAVLPTYRLRSETDPDGVFDEPSVDAPMIVDWTVTAKDGGVYCAHNETSPEAAEKEQVREAVETPPPEAAEKEQVREAVETPPPDAADPKAVTEVYSLADAEKFFLETRGEIRLVCCSHHGHSSSEVRTYADAVTYYEWVATTPGSGDFVTAIPDAAKDFFGNDHSEHTRCFLTHGGSTVRMDSPDDVDAFLRGIGVSESAPLP